MHVRHEELWQGDRDTVICVTTNNVINHSGLVMGRGSALRATELYPNVRRDAVRAITRAHPDFANNLTDDYGFVLVYPGLGLFQSKRHYNDVANLETIRESAQMLTTFAVANPHLSIRLPFPGIGAGKIGNGTPPSESEILVVLQTLPDNVIVVKRNLQHIAKQERPKLVAVHRRTP